MAHILVIEANDSLRAAIATILELAGYQVTATADGATGVASIFNDHPDLLLSATHLPYVDGFGVLQILRQNPSPQQLPLIFLTTHMSRAELRRSAELGANGYLITPFQAEELLQLVKRTLNSLPPTVHTPPGQ